MIWTLRRSSPRSKLGVALRVEGANIVHRGPRGALRPDLIAKLKARKPDIIAQLASAKAPSAPCPANIAERSAIIADGDHCDRNIADSRALAEAGYGTGKAFSMPSMLRFVLPSIVYPCHDERVPVCWRQLDNSSPPNGSTKP